MRCRLQEICCDKQRPRSGVAPGSQGHIGLGVLRFDVQKFYVGRTTAILARIDNLLADQNKSHLNVVVISLPEAPFGPESGRIEQIADIRNPIPHG